MDHYVKLALEYWRAGSTQERTPERLQRICTSLSQTYALTPRERTTLGDAATAAAFPSLPTATATLAQSVYSLSSGTMATLTGQNGLARLDDIQNRFALWCAGKTGEYATWQEAWSAYWPTDPQYPAAPRPTMQTLATALETAGRQTQAQLDKEAIEVERATKLRPCKAQAPPTGFFEQVQGTLL